MGKPTKSDLYGDVARMYHGFEHPDAIDGEVFEKPAPNTQPSPVAAPVAAPKPPKP